MRDQRKELTPGQQLNVGLGFLCICSVALTPFLRRPGTFGPRHANVWALASVLFQFVFITLVDGPRRQVAAWASVATVLMFLVHKVRGHADPRTHTSNYGGDSWLSRDQDAAKGRYEPMLCLGLWPATAAISDGFFWWFLLAFLGLGATYTYAKAQREAYARRINDERIMAQAMRDELDRYL